MTTFQDPQSRRAVRQSERGETAESPSAFTQQEPAAPQFYSGPSDSSPDLWNAERAASFPAPRAGRRAAVPAAPEAVDVAPEDGTDVVDAPTATAPSTEAAPAPEQFLSRRELRARQRAEEARSAGSVPELIEPNAPAEVPTAAAVQQAVAQADQPIPFARTPFEALFDRYAPLPEGVTDEAGSDASSEPADAEPTAAEDSLPDRAPVPAATPELAGAVAEFDSLTGATPAADDLAVYAPPVGHWSTQAELENDSQDYGSPLERSIGSGSTATHALVLPSAPDGTDIRGPLTGTGEIILTGSIDLPLDLSSTGSSDRFDDHGIDSMFDADDVEVISTNSAPVRAISAVSTHTGQGITHTQKPKGTRALTGLVIASSSMAVIVAGLLVAAFAFNIF